MMKFRLRSLSIFAIIFSFVVFFNSCGGRPSYVLSEKKMVSLMADMELAEAYMNTQNGVTNSNRIDLGERVLEAHGVSEEMLDSTLAWYGRNIDDYEGLFEKVDEEIAKRRKKYTEVEGLVKTESDNLWPYSRHLVMSPLSGYDSFSFSLPVEEIEKGDIVTFSLFLPNTATTKATLGVEYGDGSGEAAVSTFTSKNRLQLELHSDSSRSISKIYGIMRFNDDKKFPLFIDSISLRTEPLDSTMYRSKRRSQKSFGGNF